MPSVSASTSTTTRQHSRSIPAAGVRRGSPIAGCGARITRRHRLLSDPPPAYYRGSYEEAGIEIDRQGWTGGVGYGTSGDFVDGYGMMHYGWNNRQNGPTYNSFNQSFQHNPSVARPFQPRRMGQPIPTR